MRIVHLAVSDITGGAARSAYRLHRALLALGEDSAMLVRDKASHDPTVHFLEPMRHPLALYGELLQRTAIDYNRSEVTNTYFSLGGPGQDVSRHPLVLQADVINLHWVAGVQSPTDLAALLALGKKLVWTLHDMRPLTGGCHFSAGCANYQKDCAGCPQLLADPYGLPAAVLADQFRVLENAPLTAVAPSAWLAQCVRQSRVFSRTPIETIPYGVDTDTFSPMLRSEARRTVGMPEDSFLMLAGADYGAERRKGFHALAEALRFSAADPVFRQRISQGSVALLTFGRPSDAFADLPLPVRPFGYIDADEKLRALYSAADLFVLPSLEDNLPNTILESLSCGTPVAAFNVGGVPDLVQTERTGFIAPAGDARALGNLIAQAAAQTERLSSMRSGCREHSETSFRLDLQARRYRELYQRLEASTPRRQERNEWPGPALQSIFAPQLLLGLERHGFRAGPDKPDGGGPPPTRSRASRLLCYLLRDATSGRISIPSLLHRLEALSLRFEGSSFWWLRSKYWLGRLRS